MRLTYVARSTALWIGLLVGLSACSVLGAAPIQKTRTPVPTSSIPDTQVIPPQACRVAQQEIIRVENPQGDLVSWSPLSDQVAYISTSQDSSWNVGELDLLSAPQFDPPLRLATQAAGELSWSPDGTSLAYLGLRRSDNLYTIGLAYPNGRASTDLFPGEAARTDDYSSQKSIVEWLDPGRLRVLVSCGINCLQPINIGVLSGLSSPAGDPIERPWDLWAPHTYQPSTIPEEYASLPGQLNWSADGDHIAYIDSDGNAWVVNVASSTLYPLDIGQYATASETDWSFDGQYLAVRVDRNLMIFSFNCP
jgi:hypothetical protein